MSRKAKGPGFKMRSGNNVPFKQIGSGTLKDIYSLAQSGKLKMDPITGLPSVTNTSNFNQKSPDELLSHFQSHGFNFTTPQEAMNYNKRISEGKKRRQIAKRQMLSRNESLDSMDNRDFWSQYSF